MTLTPAQRSELAKAVNHYALTGGDGKLPTSVSSLKPIEVYRSHFNVVIAMRRAGGEELGYYIQPWTSSFYLGGEPVEEWSFVPLSGADDVGTVCHAYRRLLKGN